MGINTTSSVTTTPVSKSIITNASFRTKKLPGKYFFINLNYYKSNMIHNNVVRYIKSQLVAVSLNETKSWRLNMAVFALCDIDTESNEIKGRVTKQ